MTNKIKLPAWAGCLLLIGLTIWGTLRFWQPITDESGTVYTLRLERVYVANRVTCLDFGQSNSFRLPEGLTFEVLLEPAALGQTYTVTADYRASRNSSRRSYYEVYALTGADGTEYLTIEQSEARRLEQLPLRLTLIVGLDILACGLLIWAEKRRAKAAAEEQQHEAANQAS